jgi:P27 family predicted phage terminase small subunit
MSIPEPPEFLSGAAAERWHRLWASEVDRHFIRPESHADIAAAYCAAYAEFSDANSKIAETNTVLTKNGKVLENPYLQIRDQDCALATMESAGKVLGLNRPAKEPRVRTLRSYAETLLAGDESEDSELPQAPRLLTQG